MGDDEDALRTIEISNLVVVKMFHVHIISSFYDAQNVDALW